LIERTDRNHFAFNVATPATSRAHQTHERRIGTTPATATTQETQMNDDTLPRPPPTTATAITTASSPATAITTELVKRGRKTKRTRQTTATLTTAIRAGLPFKLACAKAGIATETFFGWRRRFDDFDQLIEKAVADGINSRLAAIEEAGQTDWKAVAWLLEHCHPEFFAKSRLEVAHVGAMEHRFIVDRETLDAIAEARRVFDTDETVE